MPYYYTPFRTNYESQAAKEIEIKPCVFCDDNVIEIQALRNSDAVLYENAHYYWVVNWFPRVEAHTMIVPKRHITNISEETPEEILARQQILIQAVTALQQAFNGTGFECFLQTGKDSLSSIEHLHWHVVPTSPQIHSKSMEKLGYFWTTQPDEEKVVMQPTKITMAREELIQKIAAHN